MDTYNARDVLNRYVTALGASGDALIRDANSLGYPKDIVKFVLQHCIRTIEPADQQRFLRDAYLSLAGFQVLSEEEREAALHLNQIWPAAPEEDGQAERLGEAAAPLEAVLDRIRSETIILAQELKSLQGATAAS